MRAFCGPGDNVVTADKTFAVYEWVARFSGVEPRLSPCATTPWTPKAMLAAVTERTRLVFVCNPNNPTGTWWDERTRSAS